MKQSVPESVEEYIAAQPESVRPKLEEVRAAIRKAVPEAVEVIGYRMPGSFFEALKGGLRRKGYELRKGTIHFSLKEPVPVRLISRIAKLRAAGISAAAKKRLPGRAKPAVKQAQ